MPGHAERPDRGVTGLLWKERQLGSWGRHIPKSSVISMSVVNRGRGVAGCIDASSRSDRGARAIVGSHIGGRTAIACAAKSEACIGRTRKLHLVGRSANSGLRNLSGTAAAAGERAVKVLPAIKGQDVIAGEAFAERRYAHAAEEAGAWRVGLHLQTASARSARRLRNANGRVIEEEVGKAAGVRLVELPIGRRVGLKVVGFGKRK